jgi:Fe-S cluster biogenesis protein NfuA
MANSIAPIFITIAKQPVGVNGKTSLRSIARHRFSVEKKYCKTGLRTGIIRHHKKGEHIMKEKVIEALKKIRPMLQRDGGDIELVDVEADGTVNVRLKGACGSCPMSTMTLKMGVEKTLKEEVPGVKAVVQVA